MQYSYTRLFTKQIGKLHDKGVIKAVKKSLEALGAATSLNEVPNLAKLSGYKSCYRIRVHDYRIGVHLEEDDSVIISCIYHRREIYKRFL